MRKMKRILSFIMACVMFVSSANISVYATEMDEPVIKAEEAVETTERDEETTEIIEFTEMVGQAPQEPVEVLMENRQELSDVREYDDLLEMEAVEIDPNEITGEVYDAEELVELAESMPALMSTSYDLYWNNYGSYYIYNHLSEDEQKLWDALEILYASYLEDEIDLTNGYTEYVTIDTIETITLEQLQGFTEMFRYSHPQFYFLNLGFSYYVGESMVMLGFRVYDAFVDGTDRKNATNAIKVQLDIWYEQIALVATEEEKVKTIHDLICDNVDYNHGVLEGDDKITSQEEEIYFTQSAYSVFCTDLTVCAGYTQTFTWLCNAFDIGCFGVTSPGHAWNKVKVNDNWYNMDVTWDDGVGVGDRNYHCYLKNDVYIDNIGSHEENDKWLPYLPACTLDSGAEYWDVGSLPVITQKVATPVVSVIEESTGYAVIIECATEGAKIFYTLDGKTPSDANAKGDLYTGIFRINQTGTIRAIAVCDGYLDSVVAEGGSIAEIAYIVDSGACGTNVIWKMYSNDVLTISGSGDMDSYVTADEVPWYIYSQKIQNVKVEDGVTSIGDYAFSSLTNIQTIEMADSITKIGAYAFCYSTLTEIKLPAGVTEICDYAFYGAGLTKIEMSSKVTKIGNYAFYNSQLEEIEIPASVAELGTYAFANCYNLEYVKIYGNPTTIAERVFENCDKLTEVKLSDTYTKIGVMMFLGCDALVSIELPESLTEIGTQALSFCTKLEEITIPAKVIMDVYAFYSSTGLKKVTIEDGVTTIPYGAFNECTALEEIRIPKSVTTIERIAIDATATIYGYAGSAAETYANNNGNLFVNIGATECEVKFVTGTEEQIASVSCPKNSLITAPTLSERMGYTFDGWYISESVHDESTKWDFANDTVTKAMTLYAYWIPNVYEVTLNAGEGTVNTEKINVTFDAPYGELPTPERANYTFLGWYTMRQGGELVTAETLYTSAATTTLYAQWSANQYTITFDANGGNVDTTESVVTFDEVYGELPVPTREGYTFKGWYTDQIAGELIEKDAKVSITQSQTVYARWEANTYEVTLDANGGILETEKINVTYGSVYGELPVPVKTGYTFTGWYIALEGGSEVSAETIVAIAANHTLYARFDERIIDSGTCGEDLTWKLVPNDAEETNYSLIIAGSGAMDEFTNESPCPWGSYKSKITRAELKDGVTSLSKGAFSGCSSIAKIIIPNSTVEFAGNTFEGCELTSVGPIGSNCDIEYGWTEHIPEEVFTEMSTLTSVEIADGITSIGESAFCGCANLVNINIPNSVKKIGASAFRECRSLKKIVIPGSVTQFEGAPFYGCGFTSAGPIGSGCDYEYGWSDRILAGAFSGCAQLREVELIEGIKSIEERAFQNCTALTEIVIPNGVKGIGAYAFNHDTNLIKITLPSSVTSIDRSAFYGCGFTSAGPIGGGYDYEYGWTEIIPGYAFAGCEKLKEVKIADSITTIEDSAFYGCTELKKIVIPQNVINLGWNLFSGCAFETAGPIGGGYNIEYGWTEIIPEHAFSGCDKLKEVVIADGIKSIKDYALYLCDNLEKLIIPNSVATIENINSNDFYYLTVYGYRGTAAETYATEKGLKFEDIADLMCTLTFNGNGTEADDIGEKVIFKGEACGDLPIVSRTGYTFLGWYTESEGGEKVTATSVFNQNTTLYAHWSVNTYTVTFDGNGGTFEGTVSREIAFGTSYGELPVPTRTGATFLGWYTALEEGEQITAEDILSIDANHTLYALWDLEEYVISFDANGGRTPEDIIVHYGEPYGELPDTALVGAKFLGWFTEPNGGTQVYADSVVDFTESKTLYAHWELKYALEAPVADVEGYDPIYAGTRVKLSTSVNGASIYYTLDGTEPSKENGILYEDAIEITEDCILKAYAVKAGWKDSPVVVYEYQLIDESQEWGDIFRQDIEEKGFITTADVPNGLWLAGVEEEVSYTGKAITFPETLHVYNYKTLLIEKVDYTVKYKNNLKAGTATITITGKGNYTGSIVKTFEIEKLSLQDATITDVTVQYNGKVQKATTTVTYLLDGKTVTLKKGTDFEYVYPGTDKRAEDYDAGAFKEIGNHTAYIVGKGNYYTDEEEPVSFDVLIVEGTHISKVSVAKIPNQKYTGGEIMPEIKLTYKGKPLEEDKDYVIVDFINNDKVGTATIQIEGMGDYAGSREVTFKITGTSISKAKIEGFKGAKSWEPGEVQQDVILYTSDGEELIYGEDGDYIVSYVNNTKIGTATMLIEGRGGYTGTVKKTFKITGLPINKAIVNGLIPSMVYDGNGNKQTEYDLEYVTMIDGEPQTDYLYECVDGIEDGHYTVSYKNNQKAGTATIIFTGVNGYTGTLKKTYKITQKEITAEEVNISEVTDQTFTKNGVTPKPVITFDNGIGEEPAVLVEGKDYTLKYANNKAITKDTDTKLPTVTITGKGSFKGVLTQTFRIVSSDLSDEAIKMTATDITYQDKAGLCKPTIALIDANGKKLAAGTDYNRAITYTYVRDVEVTQLENGKRVYKLRSEDDPVEKEDIIPVGAEIRATVEGIKNYTGSKSVIFRYIAGNIAKASIKVNVQAYTGKPVEPTKNDITVKIGSTTLAKTDYVIEGYSNNTQKGNGKLTIRGIGDYSGEKTVTFKINTRTMNYTIVYDKNAVDATGKMKDSIIPAGKNLTANAYKRTGYTFAGWTVDKEGNGYLYKNKEGFYLQDAEKVYGFKVTLYAQWVPTEYKITYKLNGGVNSELHPAVYTIETDTILLEAPEREGYVFGGWYTNSKFASDSQVTEIITGSTGNKTLYAKWIKIE